MRTAEHGRRSGLRTAVLLALLWPVGARADLDQALQAYRKAVALNPQLVHTIQNEDVRHQLRADFLASAVKAEQGGNLPEAERLYLLAGNFGEDFDLYRKLGAVYMRMEAWSKAVVVFKKAVASDATSVIAMADLAKAYQKAGQDKLASRFYARAISMDPAILPKLQITPVLARKVRQEMIDRAQLLGERGMPLDAAAKLDLALALGDSADLRVIQSRHYEKAGDPTAAAKAFALAMDLDGEVADEVDEPIQVEASRVLYAMGSEAFQKQDLPRAHHLFERSLKLRENGRTYYNLGNIHVHAGKLDMALRFYRQAVEHDADLDEARLNMAMVQLEKGLASVAVKELRELVSRNPQRSEAYDLIAQSYSTMRKPGKALKVYQAAVNFDPALAKRLKHKEVKEAAALAFLEQAKDAFEGKDFSGAIEEAGKALVLDPSAAAHYLVGNARFAMSDPSGAVVAYEEGLKLRGDHAPTLNNLGNALLKLKDYPKAVQAFRRATEARPDYAQAYNNLGIALRKAGKLDEAIKAYQKALEIDPNYAAAYFNLGNAFQVRGG